MTTTSLRVPRDLETLTAWHDYESRNHRANVDYRLRPSMVPLIIASLDRFGVGVTCTRFQIPPGALAAWFPELFVPTTGDAA